MAKKLMEMRLQWQEVVRGDILVDAVGRDYFVVESNHPARAKDYRVIMGRRLLGDGMSAGGHRHNYVTLRREVGE